MKTRAVPSPFTMRHQRITSAAWLLLLCVVWTPAWVVAEPEVATTEVASWRGLPDRAWPGPQWWANRLQDWAVVDGSLRCVAQPGGAHWRTAHLLSHDLQDRGDRFRFELELGSAQAGQAGLLIAAGEGGLSYKQAAQVQTYPGKGGGFLIVWDFGKSKLAIRDFGDLGEVVYPPPAANHRELQTFGGALPERITLVVAGTKADETRFTITAQILSDQKVLAESTAVVPTTRLTGNVALVSIDGKPITGHTFHALRVGGGRVAHHTDRNFGPIAGVLYSVASGDLKVGVQCVSLGRTITKPSGQQSGSRLAVRLERLGNDGQWHEASPPTGVSEPDYYALLRVKHLDTAQPHQFRVVMNGSGDTQAHYTFDVPAEPAGDVVIGGVSCTGVRGRNWLGKPERLPAGGQFVGRWTPANLWAPYEGVTEPLRRAKPNIVFFTGDQLYEGNPTPQDPTDAFPAQDYLYKWLIWVWSFGELTRSVPCILQTDDHDVWHPNLWGDGGRLMTHGWDAGGGFLTSSYFVNMVQRTMCGHNPDAYDPGPLDSGVTNYFTTFTYGGVDFALLEDRKFKSAASEGTRQAKPLQLLGDSQMKMLDEWANATARSPARIVVSQTIYAKVSTNGKGIIGEDRDTDSWPKPARDQAVDLFQRSGAVLFTGDQHLATVSRLETAEGPGVYQFCQPAGGCIWWRWFYPNADEHLGTPGEPDYTGHFADGSGNAFEVLAVANPGPPELLQNWTNPPPYVVTAEQARAGVGTKRRLHEGEGFAIIRVLPDQDQMVFECWPNGTDFTTTKPPQQFFGWPIALRLSDLHRISERGSP